MTSLADLYELHTKECREAGRIDDPVHLVILRLMARAWLEGRGTALPASTQTTSPNAGVPARSENRAA